MSEFEDHGNPRKMETGRRRKSEFKFPVICAALAYNPIKAMQTLRLDLPDPVYAEAQRAAEERGYPDMASYVAALISQDAESFDHLFTRERLALIDQAVEEADAGKVLTLEQSEARSAEMKAAWRRANLG